MAFVEYFCSCAQEQVRAFHFNFFNRCCVDLFLYNVLSSVFPLNCFLFYARLTSSSKFAYLLCVSDFCLKLIMTLLLFFFLYPSCYVLHRSIRTPRTPLSLNYGRFVRPQQGCRLFRRSLAPRPWNPADGGAAPPVR